MSNVKPVCVSTPPGGMSTKKVPWQQSACSSYLKVNVSTATYHVEMMAGRVFCPLLADSFM